MSSLKPPADSSLPPPSLDEALRDRLRAELLRWYDVHQRDLPWRGVHDPYATWVSEVMLQQTQVITVRAYYERWMEAFPSVRALAEADAEEVLALWAGLGYYRRARSLHAAARLVVEQMDAVMPDSVEGLKRLPGVGDYTAGAIASIAYDVRAPLVDGNVERVFARLFAIEGDPKARSNQRRFWAIAEELVDDRRPGDFNQALMELGATICAPKNPACLLCPVRPRCAGYASGEPTRFPAKVKRARPKPVQIESLVVRLPGDRFVLVKRPEEGLLAGLLEAPSTEPRARAPGAQSRPDRLEALERLERELASLKLPASILTAGGAKAASAVRWLDPVEHAFSHLKMLIFVATVEVDEALVEAVERAVEGSPRLRIIRSEELGEVGLSAAQRKVFRRALELG